MLKYSPVCYGLALVYICMHPFVHMGRVRQREKSLHEMAEKREREGQALQCSS